MIDLFERAHSKIMQHLWQLFGRQRLKLIGVHAARSVRFYGLPIVQRAPDSLIEIGARTVLCSDSRYTALGVSKPTIIRTLRTGASVVVGDDVGMSGATICAAISVTIGDRCLLGADCVIVDTDFHPLDYSGRRYAALPESGLEDAVVIESDVFIGSGAMILKGVTIGRGAVVGARSVVTRDVASFTIVAGVPARPVGSSNSHVKEARTDEQA